MSVASRLLAAGLLAALAPAALGDGLTPGSVLIYPIQRSSTFDPDGNVFFSVISVTNSNLTPSVGGSLGGSTSVHWEYVNTVANPANSQLPLDCQVVDRVEYLTPADTRSVLTNCHNASPGQEGYLVITALDPTKFKQPWSHNYLMGSEMVVQSSSLVYFINAIPFDAIADEGQPTDEDNDGELDFDNVEYEGIPDDIYLDIFTGGISSSLILINMTGGFAFTANVGFDIWNDNEFPLSTTIAFRCWMEELIGDISPIFTIEFLTNNTPHDPNELDFTCNNVGDLETGWCRIRGLNAFSDVESIQNPALLGAYAKGILPFGGRRLWESPELQENGDFFKTGHDDPEEE